VSGVAARLFIDFAAMDRAVFDALAVVGEVGDELPSMERLLERRGVLRAYAVLLLPVAEAYWLRLPANHPERGELARAVCRAEYALSLEPHSHYDVAVVDTRILARAVKLIREHLTRHGRCWWAESGAG
jgi:hypothetical protein